MAVNAYCLSSYKPAGTNSFRLSSGQFLGTYGANLQNPDKEALDIYVAPEGYSFIQPDQSGAEALIVAHIARPGRYRELFQLGIKPHTFVAMHVFIEQYASIWPLDGQSPTYWKALTPAELKLQPGWKALDKAIKDSGKPYKIGKMICHASSYRMRERTFQLQALKQSGGTLVLSLDECRIFLKFFADLFPEIIDWQDEIEIRVKATRELRNLFNYPRRFERMFTDGYVREAISWIPQSTVGCITHRAIRKYNADIPAGATPAVNNKHDSFMALAKDEVAESTAQYMSACMAAKLVGRDGVEFVMKSEFKIGKTWGDL
jgi:hypothetical protein